jgi:hypothetical protein
VIFLLECTSTTHTWKSPSHCFRVNQLTTFATLVINNSLVLFLQSLENRYRVIQNYHTCPYVYHVTVWPLPPPSFNQLCSRKDAELILYPFISHLNEATSSRMLLQRSMAFLPMFGERIISRDTWQTRSSDLSNLWLLSVGNNESFSFESQSP